MSLPLLPDIRLSGGGRVPGAPVVPPAAHAKQRGPDRSGSLGSAGGNTHAHAMPSCHGGSSARGSGGGRRSVVLPKLPAGAVPPPAGPRVGGTDGIRQALKGTGAGADTDDGHGVVFIPRLPPRPPSSDQSRAQWLQKLLYAHSKLAKELQQVADQIETLKPGFTAQQMQMKRSNYTPPQLSLAPAQATTEGGFTTAMHSMPSTEISSPRSIDVTRVPSERSFFSPRAHKMLTLQTSMRQPSMRQHSTAHSMHSPELGRLQYDAPTALRTRSGSLGTVGGNSPLLRTPLGGGEGFRRESRGRKYPPPLALQDRVDSISESPRQSDVCVDFGEMATSVCGSPRVSSAQRTRCDPVAEHTAMDPTLSALAALQRVQKVTWRRDRLVRPRKIGTPEIKISDASLPSPTPLFDETSHVRGIDRLLKKKTARKFLADAPGMRLLLEVGRTEVIETDRPKPGLYLLEHLFTDSRVHTYTQPARPAPRVPKADANPLGHQVKQRLWLREASTGHHHLRQILEVCNEDSKARPGVEALISLVGFGFASKRRFGAGGEGEGAGGGGDGVRGGNEGSTAPTAAGAAGGRPPARPSRQSSGGGGAAPAAAIAAQMQCAAERERLGTPNGCLRLKPGLYQKPKPVPEVPREVYELVPLPPASEFPDGYKTTKLTAPRPPPTHPMAPGATGPSGMPPAGVQVVPRTGRSRIAHPRRGSMPQRPKKRDSEFLYEPTPPDTALSSPSAAGCPDLPVQRERLATPVDADGTRRALQKVVASES